MLLKGCWISFFSSFSFSSNLISFKPFSIFLVDENEGEGEGGERVRGGRREKVGGE